MTPNIASPEHKADPFPFYARLRAEAPVYNVRLPDKKTAWLITRYDDAAMVLKDPRFAKDQLNAWTGARAARSPWAPGFMKPLTRNMLDVDEPDHTRLRGLVNKAFTPNRIEHIRARIHEITDALIGSVPNRGQIDLIRDYALPLPTTVIAEVLGVPAEDRHQFSRWSEAIVAADSSRWGMVRAVPSLWLFLRYIRSLVRSRRDNPKDDMVSALIEVEEDGERLDEDELLAMIFLLLVAGYETTVNLIGNGMLALLEHPDQMERLGQNRALIKPAVEELLRYSSPLEVATERYAREDVTISGITIPRGSLVFVAILSANRDPRQFADADNLDITREPNNHLAFGLGSHYCLGAPLARMEAQIAIGTLLDRTSELRLVTKSEALTWRRSVVLRGLKALPVAFTAKS